MPAWLVWASVVVAFSGFWFYGLFDLDEGFYAAAAGEMSGRGEWIVPNYNGEPWLEKPILLYWLAIPLIRLFGEDVGPRLGPVLCSLGALVVLASFARRRLGGRTALLAVAALASSPLFLGAGRMMLADPPLVLFLTLGLLAWYESLASPRWVFVAGASLGLAVLAKGPVALALLVLIAIGYAVWERGTARVVLARTLATLPIALLVTCAWYVPAYLALGDTFVQDFLVAQNLARYSGGDAAHAVPGLAGLAFYPVVLLIGMLPWSLFAVPAWPRGARARDDERPMLRFLALWAAVVVVFFTGSAAKLPHYALPAMVPLAVLVAHHLAGSRRPWLAIATGLAFAWGPVATFGFRAYHEQSHAEVQAIARRLRAEGGDVAIYQMSRREKDRGTGGATLMETSHPSILFYLRSTALDTDDFERILAAPSPIWIVTRAGRLGPADERRAEERGRRLELHSMPQPSERYRLYRLE